MRTEGRKVQRQIVLSLKAREIIVLRLNPFFWFYLNIGKYQYGLKKEECNKRIALDFFFESSNTINGFGFEKVLR